MYDVQKITKRVVWVIKQDGVEHTFKTLKAAKASGLHDPVFGTMIIIRRAIKREYRVEAV
jgi:hypothetical protein